MPRFRSVPSAVHTSPEWVKSTALARTVHRIVRPSAGEQVLVRVGTEAPWEQFQRFAGEFSAHYSAAECEQIVADCLASGLWQLREGVVVITAFPPSFEERRARERLGPRGGVDGATKQRDYRDRKLAREQQQRVEELEAKLAEQRARLEELQKQLAEKGVSVTAPNGNSDHSEKNETPPALPLSSPPRRGEREGGGEPDGNANTNPPAERQVVEAQPATTTEAPSKKLPQEVPDELAHLAGAAKAARALELLAAANTPTATVFDTTATRAELDAFATALRELKFNGARLQRIAAHWKAEPTAVRETFTWSDSVKRDGVASIGVLLGKRTRDGYKASGLTAADRAAVAWERRRAASAPKATRASPIASTPGPIRAAPTGETREEFMKRFGVVEGVGG